MSETLPCQVVVEILTDHLEGALRAGMRAAAEAHLAGCDDCSTYLEQLRQVVRLAGTLREEDLSPAARDALGSAFRTWRARRPTTAHLREVGVAAFPRAGHRPGPGAGCRPGRHRSATS